MLPRPIYATASPCVSPFGIRTLMTGSSLAGTTKLDKIKNLHSSDTIAT